MKINLTIYLPAILFCMNIFVNSKVFIQPKKVQDAAPLNPNEVLQAINKLAMDSTKINKVPDEKRFNTKLPISDFFHL